MDHSRRATSSRGQATSGSSSRSVLSDSEARALQLWLDRGHKLARSIDVEEKHRANLGLSVWSYTPDTLNGLRTICRAIATKSDHLSKHADVTEREITVAAQELLKRSRAEDPRDMYLSDYMDFHKTVDTALGSLYSYAKKHDSDGASVYLLQQVTNGLRPHEAEREASGLGSWVGAYLRSESDARRLLTSCEDLEADNQRWEQDCRGLDAENKSLRAEKQDLLRRLGLLETSRGMEYTASSPSVPRTIEPNSRALPTRRPQTPHHRSESRASQGSSNQFSR
ncbi:hypothetical protein EHS25_000551 [Saitozyma podzolica]|uniref:Uncharacterized protein n=1 Tax=Saitozyma podzolica TaxID=1890683 RepID=A0A427YWK0_9TREE|nr:hypothetical protein EHS25_000551 [Saitozyma podzolica]